MKIAYLTGFDVSRYPRPLLFYKYLDAKVYRLRTIVGHYIKPIRSSHPSVEKHTTPKNISKLRIPKTFIDLYYNCKRIDNTSITDALLYEILYTPYLEKIDENIIILLNTSGAISAKFLNNKNRKIIIDLMDLWSCESQRLRLNAIDFLALKKADCVFVWSKAILYYLKSIGIKCVRYLPFGVDLSIFDPLKADRELVYEKYPDLEDKIVVGYSGGFWFVHGIDATGVTKILLAFKKVEKKLDNVILVLQTSNIVNKIASRLNIKNVIFIPQTRFNHPFRQALLRIMDIKFLTASRYPAVYLAERTTMFQYMASGGATLAEKTPGNTGVLKHGINAYLVKLNDIEGLAQALEKLIRDDELRESLGRSARRDVEKYYNWDILSNMARNYINEL
jgi:glycosyltransferase involved in cell wall biosynthesis